MRVYKPALFALSLLSASTLAQAETLLKDNQGNEIALSNLKGKWVYINYWASWCPTCLDEIPELNRFYEANKKQAIALYAVNFDGLSETKQNSLSRRFKINYPSLLRDPSDALHLGDIRGIPVTFVINPQGELVKTLYGGQTAKSLQEVMG